MILSLRVALTQGHLTDFIAHEESRGVSPADQRDFDCARAAIIKVPKSAGQTSRSPSADASSGK